MKVPAEHRKCVALKLINAPGVAHVISAPPVLIASFHTIDYACGRCGTVLLHADDNQVHNLVIHCTNCAAYNSTDD
jgi:hypothetical protein